MNPTAAQQSGPAVAAQRAGPLAQGIAAARANLPAGIILWLVGCSFVLSYYFWSPAAGAFAAIGELKVEYGFLFAAVSTAFWGGLLPFFFQKLQVGHVRPVPWAHLAPMLVYWALRGVEVDGLYRVQAWTFGDEVTFWPVVAKVLVDQLVYCPFWCIPTTVLFFLWKDSGFSLKRTRQRLGPRWYYRRVFPVMVSNWSIWVPAVALIYLLPQPLQLPMQNIVVCFWALLLLVLTAGDRESQASPAHNS